MVIGSGMLASAFEKFTTHEEVIIFASGVSNSLEIDLSRFLREENLLNSVFSKCTGKKLVYFSTYSIHYKQSLYTDHKKRMEDLVLSMNSNSLVLRVTNVVGKSLNPNTLLNFLTYHVKNDLPINVFSGVKRNLIGIDDLVAVVAELIESPLGGSVLNIGYPHSYSIEQIVNAVERFYNKNANISFSFASEHWIENYFDISTIKSITVRAEQEYLPYLLNTYYK